MASDIPLDLQLLGINRAFKRERVLYSIEHLQDDRNVWDALRMILGTKITHIDKDLSNFWFCLMTTILVSATEAAFCTEREVVDQLKPSTLTRLRYAYLSLFHRAGLIGEHEDQIFELLRMAYLRQRRAEYRYIDPRNASFSCRDPADMHVYDNLPLRIRDAKRVLQGANNDSRNNRDNSRRDQPASSESSRQN